MKFDDFNYQVYNPYILVQEEKKKDKGKGDKESLTDGIESSGPTLPMVGLGGVGQGPALSVYNLEQKNYGKYEF